MKRTYVRAVIELSGAWRIGSWESDAADIMRTLTDHRGAPAVPGSGIAGMLRAAFREGASTFFGPEPTTESKAKAQVSPWWILGTVVNAPDQQPPSGTVRTRRRTRINRERNASELHGLFAADEANKASVTVYFRSDTGEPEPFLEKLASREVRIGGGRTIGLGQAKLTNIQYRTIDFEGGDAKNSFLEFLSPASPIERVERLLEKGKTYTPNSPTHTPVLTAHMTVGHLAITDISDTEIHGSTFKGLLRSRVEFIGRSLGYAVCGESSQNWTGCGDCAVCEVFGHSGKPGMLEFQTAELIHQDIVKRVRIGLDRFTGGARSGAWFEQQYIEKAEWDLIVNGSLDGLRDSNSWVRAALLHALRDIDDGFVSIGPEGAAGYGHAKVTDVQMDSKEIDLRKLAAVPTPSDQSTGVSA